MGRLIEFQVDFQSKKRFKRKIILFQKKGIHVPFYRNLHEKKKQVFTCATIAAVFYGMVTCKHFNVYDIQRYDKIKGTINYQICKNKSRYFHGLGIAFLSMWSFHSCTVGQSLYFLRR